MCIQKAAARYCVAGKSRRPVGSNPAMSHHDTENQNDAVAVGALSHWERKTNRYPGCTCPPWRYHPRYPKPTDPDCPEHGNAG